MIFSSLGDNVRQFQQSRQNVALKTTLNTLINELSSGEKSDKVKATGGDTAQISTIDNRLKVLTTFAQATSETQLKLSAMQTALSSFDSQRNTLAEQLISIQPESPDFQIQQAGSNARDRLDGLINTLNTRIGSESLFSGNGVDQTALASAETMLADILTNIAGATDSVSIIAAVDTWFDDPAGGFVSIGYTGDTGAQTERRLDEGTRVSVDARADDPGLRAVLKGAVIAALSQEAAGLDKRAKAELLFEGGVQLHEAASDIAQVQGRLGFAESEVERFAVAQTTEEAALTIARNSIVQADPFETASELQAVQLQLETHYALTARISQLSLLEYLR
jgi:flagellar hook-associated protein 3 FlgL